MDNQRKKRRKKIDMRLYTLPIDSEEYLLLEGKSLKDYERLRSLRKDKNQLDLA